MADPVPFRRPINWAKLRADQAEKIIRERAKVTGNVLISVHAYDQLKARSEIQTLIDADVYWILQNGFAEGQPILENGEWKVIMVRRMPGCREAGVVTLIVSTNEEVFVKTVEWMDWIR